MPLIYSIPTTYTLKESDDSYQVNVINPKDPRSYEIMVAKLASGKYKLVVEGDDKVRDFIVGPIDHENISITMSDAFSPYGNVMKISVPKISRDPFDINRERVIAARRAQAERAQKERAARARAQRASHEAARAKAQAKAEAKANAKSVEAQAMEALRAETQKRVDAAKKANEENARKAQEEKNEKDEFTPQDLVDILGGLFNNVQLGSNYNGCSHPPSQTNPLESLLKAFVPQFGEQEEMDETKRDEKKEDEATENKREPEDIESAQECEKSCSSCSCDSVNDKQSADKFDDIVEGLEKKLSAKYDEMAKQLEKKLALKYDAMADRLEKKYSSKFEELKRVQQQLESRLAKNVMDVERKVNEKVSEVERNLTLKLSQAEFSIMKNDDKEAKRTEEIKKALDKVDEVKASITKFKDSQALVDAKIKSLDERIAELLKYSNASTEQKDLEEPEEKKLEQSDDDFDQVIKATSVEESPLTPSTGSPLKNSSPIGSPVIKVSSHVPEMQEVEDEEFVMIRKKFGE